VRAAEKGKEYILRMTYPKKCAIKTTFVRSYSEKESEERSGQGREEWLKVGWSCARRGGRMLNKNPRSAVANGFGKREAYYARRLGEQERTNHGGRGEKNFLQSSR